LFVTVTVIYLFIYSEYNFSRYMFVV